MPEIWCTAEKWEGKKEGKEVTKKLDLNDRMSEF